MRSQIRLAFNTQEEGATLCFPTPDGSHKFNCAELKATLTKAGTEIILSGNIDGRVPYQGTILPNSPSKLNVLKYLSDTLAKKNHQGPSPEFSKMMGLITDEISKIILVNSQAGKHIESASEIYAPDLTWTRLRKKSKLATNTTGLLKSKKRKMVLFSSLSKEELNKLPYGALSGFINLEIQAEESTYDSSTWEREGVEFLGVKVNPESGVLARVSVKVSELLKKESLFFFHIHDVVKDEWVDIEGRTLGHQEGALEIDVDLPESSYQFANAPLSFSFYVQGRYESKKLWLTSPGETYSAEVVARKYNSQKNKKIKPEAKLKLGSFESIAKWCSKRLSDGPISAEAVLGEEGNARKFIEAYHEALKKLSKRASNSARSILRAVRTLGIENVFIVSPEGPHAIAGGLAQVVKGLSMSFDAEGIPIKLISPLYENSSGHNNLSASDIVRDGFNYLGEQINLVAGGDVLIPFGEIVDSKSETVEVKKYYRALVYTASFSKIEFIFIRHKKMADRLYGGMSSRDLLERAIFLSRGSLEVIDSLESRKKKGILLSNDWLSALVEPFKELDRRYQSLKGIQILHVLHNAGRGYQGRIAISENGFDLWRLLKLPIEAKPLFLEEGSQDILNLTEACLKVSKVGALTVSKPYAEQLVTEEHGEGLNKVLAAKSIYGISNGISENLVRGSAFGDLQGSDVDYDLGIVSDLKSALLKEAQVSLGLEQNAQSLLAVMIGRLTEQKGISLLSPSEERISVFESMLLKYPSLQIAVVGPGSDREEEFVKFRNHLRYLSEKFPGRVSGRFEFVDPTQAIRYTAGASLFLMPSRYEPGGLTQLEAMCVGTSVVAHRVGGLSATLSQYTDLSGSSFLFEDFSKGAFYRAFNEAVQSFLDRDIRDLIIGRALGARNDWSHRVPYYLTLFQDILGVFSSVPFIENSEFYKTRKSLINRIRARKY